MTTTLGSLKLSLATTNAAAMLRCPVPRANARRVSMPGLPSIQTNAEAQCDQSKSAEDAARAENVENLVDIRHCEQQHHRNKN